MIDRVLAPVSRSRWLTVSVGGFYLGCTATGVLGLTVGGSGVTGLAGLSYSVGMITFGALAALSVMAGARRAEATTLVAIAVLTVLHGVLVLGTAGPQTAVRLFLTPLILIPLAVYRSQTVLFRQEVIKQIRAAEEVNHATG